jgi:hypothetical protein
MLPRFKWLFVFIFMLFFSSCGEKDINIDLSSRKWECIKMKKNNFARFKNAPKPYILTFVDDSTFILLRDVNKCEGHYRITKSGHISFNSGMLCTYMCCDSEFAQELTAMLTKMTRYYSQGDELILKGEGKIVLRAR